MTLNSINNAHISFCRLKPDKNIQNSQNQCGIATHRFLTKFFVDIFGSGTITAKVKGKTCYLNRGSCIKFLHGSKKYSHHYPTKMDLLEAIKRAFEEAKPPDKDAYTPSGSFVEPIWDSNADKSFEASYSSSTEQNNFLKKPKWRTFLEERLATKLASISKKAGIAVENGDCFFDAVAQVVGLENASHARKILKNYLEHCDSNLTNHYETLLEGNKEGYSYKDFCNQIAFSAKEVGGSVIWGNAATAQIVADAFTVEVIVHSCLLLPCNKEELKTIYQSFESIKSGSTYEICTLLDTISYKPLQQEPQRKVELANISRDPWGHWVPVFNKI